MKRKTNFAVFFGILAVLFFVFFWSGILRFFSDPAGVTFGATSGKMYNLVVNFKKAFSDTNIQMHTNDANVNEINKKWINWQIGIGHIKKQFGDILKSHNVEAIQTVGEMFDPKLHEAVGDLSASVVAAAVPQKPGTIVKEVEGGYTMGGRVIKVAKVIITK